jgi:hypothetical protein
MPLLLKLLAPLFSFTTSLIRKYQKQFGWLPEGYWLPVIKLMPTTSIELLVIKGSADDRQILLLRRPSTDPIWPNQLHFPGTVLRNGDTEESALARDAKEIGLDQFPSAPTFGGYDICHTDRCYNTALYFIFDNPQFTPTVGEFYPLNNLPKDMIQYQVGQLTRLGLVR